MIILIDWASNLNNWELERSAKNIESIKRITESTTKVNTLIFSYKSLRSYYTFIIKIKKQVDD
jgi:hypothetical protein